MLKTSLKYGGILFIAATICSLLVTYVFTIVNPIISIRTTQKVTENLNSIYVGRTFTFEDITSDFFLDKIPNADSLYKVILSEGTTDYVYQMSPVGRNDQIIFLISYSSSGKVLKIQYVQMRETKGRGDKITQDLYLNNIYKQTAQDMNVDMISGATYSSKAMKESIEGSAKHLISEVLK